MAELGLTLTYRGGGPGTAADGLRALVRPALIAAVGYYVVQSVRSLRRGGVAGAIALRRWKFFGWSLAAVTVWWMLYSTALKVEGERTALKAALVEVKTQIYLNAGDVVIGCVLLAITPLLYRQVRAASLASP